MLCQMVSCRYNGKASLYFPAIISATVEGEASEWFSIPGYDVRIVRMFAAGTFVTDLHIPDYLQAGGNVLQRLPDHFLSYGFQLGATLYAVGFFFWDIQYYLFFRQPVSYHFPFGFWLPYLYFVPG